MGAEELAYITDEQLIEDYKTMGALFDGQIGEVIKAEMEARGIWKEEYTIDEPTEEVLEMEARVSAMATAMFA